MSSTRMRSLRLGLLLMSAAGAGHCHDLVIHAGTLIDGVVDSPRRQVSILIRDERILSVESGFVSPAGAEVVDLSDSTVPPTGSERYRPAAMRIWWRHRAIRSTTRSSSSRSASS
jgi:hypothetical protein